MLNGLVLLIFPAILAYAAVSDLMSMKISNRISLGLLAGFIVLALIVGLPLQLIGTHLLTGLVVLLVTFSLFAAGWIGGGDAKLAAAIAFWFGAPLTVTFLLTAAIWGGVLTLVFLVARRQTLPVGLMNVEWITRLHDPKKGIPYGVALAAAGMMVYPKTQIFLALAQ